MNTIDTLQEIANIQQRCHGSTELQEWLECKDFILGMKGIQMGMLPVNTSSLRHCKVAVNNVIVSTTDRNNKIASQLDKFNVHWLESFGASKTMAEEIKAKIVAGMAKLSEVELEHKREVLRYMHIVPTPLAAAYLGVSADALHKMKEYEPELFGEHYAGCHSYSIEELNFIACNPHWSFPFPANDSEISSAESSGGLLDHVIMVDEEVACAYTNMTSQELFDHVPRTRLARRPYRLADLEKIRIAKLSVRA